MQNNAALSVRDDNIDEISDRETLENADSSEETAPNTANTGSFDSAERSTLKEVIKALLLLVPKKQDLGAWE